MTTDGRHETQKPSLLLPSGQYIRWLTSQPTVSRNYEKVQLTDGRMRMNKEINITTQDIPRVVHAKWREFPHSGEGGQSRNCNQGNYQ